MDYTAVEQEVSLTANWEEYSYVLNSSSFYDANKTHRVFFDMGNVDSHVYIDDVSLVEGLIEDDPEGWEVEWSKWDNNNNIGEVIIESSNIEFITLPSTSVNDEDKCNLGVYLELSSYTSGYNYKFSLDYEFQNDLANTTFEVYLTNSK